MFPNLTEGMPPPGISGLDRLPAIYGLILASDHSQPTRPQTVAKSGYISAVLSLGCDP